jgi:hypothetical protein
MYEEYDDIINHKNIDRLFAGDRDMLYIIATNILCEYLCIKDDIMMPSDSYSDEDLISNCYDIKLPGEFDSKQFGKQLKSTGATKNILKGTLSFLRTFYGIDMFVNDDCDLEIDEGDLVIKEEESLTPLYKYIYDVLHHMYFPIIDPPEFFRPNDNPIQITENDLNDVLQCNRIRHMYISLLRGADIPIPRKYELWAALVEETDTYLRNNYKDLIEE